MSASVVSIPQNNYIIKVTPGGTITFDTGPVQGDVVFTGNITVGGTQTIVNSTNLDVNDNIITVNFGESGSGITLNKSGLRMDRGLLTDAEFVFVETMQWTNPLTDTLIDGGFVFQNIANSLVGIQTNSITTRGGDLYLINEGTGVISVTGTNNYEGSVTDDDHIPNKKYVDDEIVTALTSTFQRRIEEGSTSKSFVEVRDREVSGVQSVINLDLDGINVGKVFADRAELQDLRIQDNMIETIVSDTDLILSAPGTGGIKVLDNMTLTSTPAIDDALADPAGPADGLKLYVKTPETGGTGLFFKHANATTGEIMSRKNALLLSMLF
jgi:hypothetical protein|tara:strand:- start:6024 stop:7001 length:978 start_codon:yes stop_codon:yes gene_type:complete